MGTLKSWGIRGLFRTPGESASDLDRSAALVELVPPHTHPLFPPLPFQSRHTQTCGPEWQHLGTGKVLRDPCTAVFPVTHPPQSAESPVLLLPCQVVAPSRTSRAPGPMASVERWQADVELTGGQGTGVSASSSTGTRTSGHTFLSAVLAVSLVFLFFLLLGPILFFPF